MAESVRLTDAPVVPAGFDPHRSRFRITLDHLVVLGQLRKGTKVEEEFAPVVAGLMAAGIIDKNKALHPAAEEMLAALAAPFLIIDVETTTAITAGDAGVTESEPATRDSGTPTVAIGRHGIMLAAIGDRAVAWARESWPGDEYLQFTPIDPDLTVPWVALTVGLRRVGPIPSGRVQASAPLGAAGEALAWAGRDPGMALTVLRQAGVTGPAAQQLTSVLANLRRTWRITANSPVPDDAGAASANNVRSVVVLDAGPLGLWERTSPAEPIGLEPPDPATAMTVRPMSYGDVWRAIAGVLDTSGARLDGPSR